MKSVVTSTLQMLGLHGRDRITEFEGVVTSVGFDAFGCVQALLAPPVKDGKLGESYWFDVKRIELSDKRAIKAPEFASMPVGKEPGGNKLPQPARTPAPY